MSNTPEYSVTIDITPVILKNGPLRFGFSIRLEDLAKIYTSPLTYLVSGLTFDETYESAELAFGAAVDVVQGYVEFESSGFSHKCYHVKSGDDGKWEWEEGAN